MRAVHDVATGRDVNGDRTVLGVLQRHVATAHNEDHSNGNMFDVGPHAQRRSALAHLALGELPAEAAAEHAGEDPASAAAREPRDLGE